MEKISSDEKAFLNQLNAMTGGDPEVQVSMHDVGAALGLDKSESGSMGETLIMGGFAELKTLSGGIGITFMGLGELGMEQVLGKGDVAESLGHEVTLCETALASVHGVLTDLKALLAQVPGEYEKLDEAVTDIKTIEVQLLSPRPKTAIVREVFLSLAGNLDDLKFSKIRTRLSALAGKGENPAG